MSRALALMNEEPVTICDSATVGDAVLLLQSQQVRHVPVVDKAGNLVGMLRDREIRLLDDSDRDKSFQARYLRAISAPKCFSRKESSSTTTCSNRS